MSTPENGPRNGSGEHPEGIPRRRAGMSAFRRAGRVLLHALGILVAVSILALAGVFWRLTQGPLVLGSLTPWMEAAFNEQVSGLSLRMGDAELAWSASQGFVEIRVHDVAVHDAFDRQLLAAGEVGLQMSMSPLLRGELRPRRITLYRPHVFIERDASGAVRFALADRLADMVGPGGAAHDGQTPVGALLASGPRPPFERLEGIWIVNAELRIADRVRDLVWSASDASMSVVRQPGGMAGDARMILEAQGNVLDLEIDAAYRDASSQTSVAVRAANLAPASLSAAAPRLGDLRGLDFEVDADLDLVFDAALELSQGSFSLETAGGIVDVPELFETPFDLGPSRALGRLNPGFSGFEVTSFVPDLGIERMQARLRVDGYGDDAAVEATLDLAGLPVDDLARYWPPGAAPNARTWLTENLSGGTVTRASVTYATTVGELVADRARETGLAVDLDASGVAVNYLDGMAPVADVAGHVAIADNELRIETRGGTLAGLSAGRGVIAMARLDGSDGMAIEVGVDGAVAHALRLAGQGPFAFSSRSGIDAGAVSGSFSGTLAIRLAHLGDLAPDDIAWRIDADIGDFALARALRGYRLDGVAGALSLGTDNTIRFSGNANVNGVPFAATYRHVLEGDGETVRTFDLKGRVDDAGRAALGLPGLPGIAGAVDAEVVMREFADAATGWHVQADLDGLAIELPDFGIFKERGEPGRGLVRLTERDGVLTVEDAALAFGGIAVDGRGTFDAADPGGVRLELSRVAFGRNDFAAELTPRGDGEFDLALSGSSFDMAALPDDDGSGADLALPPLHVRARLERLWTDEDWPVSRLRLEAELRDDRWETLEARGRIGDGSPAIFEISRSSPEERRFDFRAASLEDVLEIFTGFDDVEGGTLHVRGRLPDDDSAISGVFLGRNFVIEDTPILVRLLSLASLKVIGDLFSAQGLAFERVELPFVLREDVLTISDGRMVGPGIGFTVSGTADLANDMLDLEGTLVPVYALNTILGEIPLLGDILTGIEEGGGLASFVFSMRGPADDPEVRVNPLSVLAPGILRNLFWRPDLPDEESGSPDAAEEQQRLRGDR